MRLQLYFKADDFEPLIDAGNLPADEDPMNRLLLKESIVINGVFTHLEAIEVREQDQNLVQMDDGESAINAYWDLNDGNPKTVEIEGLPGRRYFLMLYPYKG